MRISDQLYKNGGPDQKRMVIGSIFPKNLTFDGFVVRTGLVSEIARILFSGGAGLAENNTGQKEGNSLLSCEVTRIGHFSNQFLSHLKLVAELSS